MYTNNKSISNCILYNDFVAQNIECKLQQQQQQNDHHKTRYHFRSILNRLNATKKKKEERKKFTRSVLDLTKVQKINIQTFQGEFIVSSLTERYTVECDETNKHHFIPQCTTKTHFNTIRTVTAGQRVRILI